MNSFNRIAFKSIIVCIILALSFCNSVWSSETRYPACAGTFYPGEKNKLNEMIDSLTEKASETKIQLPEDRPLKALIMPHAGYIYSGLTAAHASLALKGNRFKKIIIMGPDHRVGFSGCAVSNADQYETPLGRISIHTDASRLLQQSDIFRSIPASDALEHSVEAELPFLQKYLDHFEIIPIVMGQGNISQYTAAIENIVDSDTLIVASSDLSHYLSYADAVKKDDETIKMILNRDAESLAKSSNSACGVMPILVLLQISKSRNWDPVLIYHNNSGDTAGDKSKVVGYATIAFYGEKPMKQEKNPSELSREKGDVLLKLARKTIADKLEIATQNSRGLDDSLKDQTLQARRGTFVTLKIDNQLRGCIGNLSQDRTIVDGVRDNAVNAAFRDPRFRPLSKAEFDKIDIEISLLTEPKILEFKDPNDLLSKLRTNIDGVIIRKGMYSATFLPQVWEQLPDKEEFLGHLCAKAGLPDRAWKEPGLEVMTYQVQYFEEGH